MHRMTLTSIRAAASVLMLTIQKLRPQEYDTKRPGWLRMAVREAEQRAGF
eukprot:SAG11_NODE_754_length_7332_cov_5.256325_4_plen_50_part_00